MKRILFLFLILSGATAMAFDLGVKEYNLNNGLSLLMVEDNSCPVFTIMLWVPAGGITEEEGKSGLSHFLEHSYSMGSAKLKARELSELVRKWGGYKNAFTGKDYTAYYENLPSQYLEKIIELEADRFTTLAFPEDKFESEKLVIMEERRLRTDNSHFGQIFELINENAYGKHPYHHPVIGYMKDIEGLSRDDLVNYYKKHYVPANACFVVVGDIDAQKTLALFNKYFGNIPSGKKIITAPKKASLSREYRQVVYKDTEAPFICIAFPTVTIDDSDSYPLLILNSILSEGASSRFTVNIKNSKQIVNFAATGFSPQRSTTLFTIVAEGKPGVPILDVERALYEEIEAIKQYGVKDEEISRAAKKTEASFLLDLESTLSRASVIGRYETLSSEGWKYIEKFIPRLKKVKSSDIERVAKKYLKENNRTVITMVPEVAEDRTIPETDQYEKTTRYVYPNGLTVLYQLDSSIRGVTIQMGLKAGSVMVSPEKAGLASVTADLLLTGTETMTEESIAQTLDNIGADYSVRCGYDSAVLNFNALSEDFETIFSIMSDVVARPAFEEEKLERIVDEHISQYRAATAKTSWMASRLYRETVYKNHPYGNLSGGYEDSLNHITRDDVLKFHRQYYTPENMIVTVVGNIEEERVLNALEKRLVSLNSTADQLNRTLSVPSRPKGRVIRLQHKEGQTQAFVTMGYPAISRTSQDYEAVIIMNRILGGGGLASRLASKVRTEQGFAYSIYSSVQPLLSDGPFTISFQTKNESLGQALSSIFEEMERMKNETVPEQEFDDVRKGFINSLPFQTETSAHIAQALLNGQFYGMTLDYLDRKNRKIEELTTADIQRVAKKYLNTENIVITVISQVDEVIDQLNKFGKVSVVEND